MAADVQTLRKTVATTDHPSIGRRLSAALGGLGERWDGPALISGDADSRLLAIARDLQLEDRLLARRFGR